ncbi:hypothetical protein [Bradyrhizobium ottawaense]|uniref:hypothetical protein n=1 Tax=Bradyrhizobium ottawaense TaxID=931866 RepID=UPI003834DD17
MRRGIYGVSSQSAYHRSADMATAASNPQSSRANTLVAWLVLVGLVIPAAEVQVYIAGAKFTVGRLAIIPLVLPALCMLFGRTRRFVLSDLFVWATAIWIVAAAVYTDGSEALSSAGAQAIEIIGGYMVARAYFFGPDGLQGFLSVLKVFTLAAIVLAMADFASGRLATHVLFSSLLGRSSGSRSVQDGDYTSHLHIRSCDIVWHILRGGRGDAALFGDQHSQAHLVGWVLFLRRHAVAVVIQPNGIRDHVRHVLVRCIDGAVSVAMVGVLDRLGDIRAGGDGCHQ